VPGNSGFIVGIFSHTYHVQPVYSNTQLVLNPSKQAVSLASGLDYISDLIVRSKMREDLYDRRYRSGDHEEHQKLFQASHMMYRDTLKKLYVAILKFEARSIVYYAKNGAYRLGLDMMKFDGWDDILNGVKTSETAFIQVYESWKDIRGEEESNALVSRHREHMNMMTTISGDVSGLRSAIKDAQRDSKRSGLLKWLSDVDPSEFYNLAIDKRQPHTGEWLLKENADFNSWKDAPNSLLWLNGKGNSDL